MDRSHPTNLQRRGQCWPFLVLVKVARVGTVGTEVKEEMAAKEKGLAMDQHQLIHW